MRRILGPVQLTALGIGAIIGAGIFVITGRVAAQDAERLAPLLSMALGQMYRESLGRDTENWFTA